MAIIGMAAWHGNSSVVQLQLGLAVVLAMAADGHRLGGTGRHLYITTCATLRAWVQATYQHVTWQWPWQATYQHGLALGITGAAAALQQLSVLAVARQSQHLSLQGMATAAAAVASTGSG